MLIPPTKHTTTNQNRGTNNTTADTKRRAKATTLWSYFSPSCALKKVEYQEH